LDWARKSGEEIVKQENQICAIKHKYGVWKKSSIKTLAAQILNESKLI
jgi:hypothetical protein